jgi:Flp pilus assembly protein TadG
MVFERAAATLRALIRDERGNVLALTAVGLPLLFGCAAIAVDTVQWVSAKRELQAAADAAAIAGVYGLVQTGEMDASVDDSLASNPKLDPKRAVSAERSPAPYGEDPFAVRVRIASPVGMTFTKMFLSRAPTVDV